MNLDNVLAELEDDLNWRANEMRFHRNILLNLATEKEQSVFRKSMVVMLYAHYEGYSKVAFGIYASEINKLSLTCNDVNSFISAASLSDLFTALFDTQRKCDLFRRTLPEDTVVHRLARQVELINVLDDVGKRKVAIPVDFVVDTESNLKPAILRKILFRLGFPHNAFEQHEGLIEKLLGIRNSVAHGELTSGVGEKLYNDLENATYTILNEVKGMVWNGLKDAKYKKVA